MEKNHRGSRFILYIVKQSSVLRKETVDGLVK